MSEVFHVLLVEPTNLLRRTVALTLRSLGTAEVTEAATYPTAHQLCERRPFGGAVIALEWPQPSEGLRGLTLIQQIRSGESACPASMPIAVLVESCNTELLQILRSCGISRILIKPFRVRDVIDTIDGMKGTVRGVVRA
jgi:CheY-like chemotaxis protein